MHLKWTLDFDIEESPISSVWISFPNLRLHFFNRQILFCMASIFGCSLQTDQAIAVMSRPSIAKVLVELDVSKKYPSKIWIGYEVKGYFQKVDFENFLIFCSFCKMHGHGVNDCFRKHPNLHTAKNSVKQLNEVVEQDVSILILVGNSSQQLEEDPTPLVHIDAINFDTLNHE
ncbi:hypothetical protein MA16_Dca007827 [Dendrobium catenatum]|uniref:Uncharacterized protein n=1 Tax=Dendrobium catenatum TaxID=906689 RepID=A0A2I0X5G8_9ASPA|nr:hypothetical protein MA16_Dca007827 [Dendrobium catenatum]